MSQLTQSHTTKSRKVKLSRMATLL